MSKAAYLMTMKD